MDPKPRGVEYNSLKKAEETLPSVWYHDHSHYLQELANIFGKCWVYVCRADTLKEPLSYRTIAIGKQNVIVLRDANGKLQAFHNTCRHRGSVLCTEREGMLGSRVLVCPYHQWSYATTDGRLVNTTSFAEPENFDKSKLGLFPVALNEWRGCLFVNLDPDAIGNENNVPFQRPASDLVNYPLENMVTGHEWRSEIACNWKIFWENFNECLHCPNIHPELVDLVPLYRRRIINPKDVPDWPEHEKSEDPVYRGGVKEGAETWSSDASAQGHVIRELTEEDLARGHTYATTWPSCFVAGYADHVRIVRVMPLDPERMEISAEWLFPAQTLADPSYDMANVVDFAVLVMEQDAKACELNQRGLHAQPYESGVLMPEEYLLKRFHDWVREMLG